MFKMPDDGPPGMWRVIFPVPEDEDETVTLSEDLVERRMQGFVPRSGRYPVKYKSIYKVHQRVAKDFRVGRVLLAGDAAHLNNPMGAFGLNGGIHDAFSLADKLGRICRGEGDPALLDLYVRQRRSVNLEYVQEFSTESEAAEREGRARAPEELRRGAPAGGDAGGPPGVLRISSMIASVQRANAIR